MQKLVKVRLRVVRTNLDEPFNEFLSEVKIFADGDLLLEQLRLVGRQLWVLEGKASVNGLGLEVGIAALGRKLDYLLIACPPLNGVSSLMLVHQALPNARVC